jgi:hypothetical protein
MKLCLSHAFLLPALILTVASSTAASEYTYQVIDVGGEPAFSANAISNNGQIVGGFSGGSVLGQTYVRAPDGSFQVISNIPFEVERRVLIPAARSSGLWPGSLVPRRLATYQAS